MRRDSGVSNIWNSLTDTEKKLVIRYPLDALKVNTAKNIATTQTEKSLVIMGLVIGVMHLDMVCGMQKWLY